MFKAAIFYSQLFVLTPSFTQKLHMELTSKGVYLQQTVMALQCATTIIACTSQAHWLKR